MKKGFPSEVSSSNVLVHNGSPCKFFNVGDDYGKKFFRLESSKGDDFNKGIIDDYKSDILQGKDVGRIKVYEKNGKNYIIDGHHRFDAFRELGIDDIPFEYATDAEWKNYLNAAAKTRLGKTEEAVIKQGERLTRLDQ